MSSLGRGLSWRRLGVLIRQLPRDSALARSINGPDVAWGLAEQLLAAIADLSAAANWQRGGDKNVPRPQPITRPGVGDKRPKFGKGARTIEEMREFQRRWREGELAGG